MGAFRGEKGWGKEFPVAPFFYFLIFGADPTAASVIQKQKNGFRGNSFPRPSPLNA
jgi:hypothetical protein